MDAPTPRTLPPLFRRALEKYADRTAVASGERRLTYGELDARSLALANALVGMGVDPEDRVAVLLANRPAYPVVDLAIVAAGAARLPLNPMLSPSEVEYVLSDSGASTVVCDAAHVDVLAEVAPSLAASLDVVLVGGDADETPRIENATVRRYDDLVAESAETPPSVDVSPDDVAGHFYTGGTTGQPKGVVYSQAGLAASLYAHLAELGFDGSDTGLVVTPLSHSAGTFLWANLLAGATTVIQDGFDVERTLGTIESRGVTWTFMVPTMVYRLLDRGVDDRDCSSLDRLLYGAAPMRPDRLREGIEAFGPIFFQFYGQTEVPNLVTTLGRQEHAAAARASAADGDDPRAQRLQSAGQPCLLVDVRIVDPETGEPCPPGEPGEVAVASPYAFERYHERPEETARTLQDGWVHTGDIGRFDEDGYLYLLDRKRDVIITGGMNVYSHEVEDALGDHPAIRNVAVFGIPDDDWGEAVHAVVVAGSDALTAADVRAHADALLADYKKPKSVAFVDDLPTTAHGKVDKAALRDPYWEDTDRSVS